MSTSQPQLLLPSSDDVQPRQVTVNGDSVTLDHLGPLVINTDGTMSRINNWDEMSEVEQRNTMRVIVQRNRVRVAALKQQMDAKAKEEL